MIVCLYIEVKSENERNNLESILYSNDYAFYDATENEKLTKEKTLADIECQYEGK